MEVRLMGLDVDETGKHIRQFRKVAGLTQEELAQKIGISTMSIRRYENGERIASRATIDAIAAALQVDAFSLMSFDQATQALEERVNDPQRRVNAAMKQLPEEGQNKVATYAEDLILRYRVGRAPQEGGEREEVKRDDG